MNIGNSNKKSIFRGISIFNKYTITFLFVYFIATIGITYAYYAYQVQEESVIVGNVVAIDADLDVQLVVGTIGEMVPMKDDALSNAINGVGSDNGACIDSLGNLSCQVYKITLTNNGSRLKHVNGTIQLYAKDGANNAYSNLKWRELTNTTTIKDGSVINGMAESVLVSDITIESKEVKTWYIAVWLSEINADQKNIDKGEFGGTVTFGMGGSSTTTNLASEYIKNLYNDGSELTTVNIGGDTANPSVSLNATQGIMLDNNGEYRYYGANPNNYVSYNDELWRIISVSNVKSSTTDTVGETRVKIVKADILTDDNGLNTYSYDSSDASINSGLGVNDWTQADLMTELNTLYYNSTSGTCYNGQSNASTECDFTNTGLSADARNLTEDAVYYLGGSSEYEGLYADDFYTFERGTTVYNCSTDDGSCPRATTWTGRLGIIYPSDYAYATDLSLCTIDGPNYDTDGCYNNDWLLYSSHWQWTISLHSSTAYGVFFVDSTGFFDDNGYVCYAGAIWPVQYLRSEVTIVGGEGTSSNPYQLSLELPKLTEYVEDLYNDGSTLTTVNIGGDTANPTVSLNATQGIMLDNNGEYRYYGENPNNYVSYNNELWRIISVSNVKTDIDDTEGEMRVKIIRDESIGNYSWDSSDSTVNSGYGVNDWTKADLMTELNTLYYNKKSGTCYNGQSNVSTTCDFTSIGLNNESKDMIDNSLWYLGGSAVYEGLYADDYYTFERGTTVYNCSTDDGACPRATSWTGKVGLMYPSDYAYATDLNLCNQNGNYYDTDLNCSKNDWLYINDYQWTLSSYSGDNGNIFIVHSLSGIDCYGAYHNYGLRPTVYLKSDVLITGGTGTSGNPYQILLS